MKQENFFTANADLTFSFDHVAWEDIVPVIEEGFHNPAGPSDTAEAVDLYREALTLIGEYAGHDIAGRARAVDAAGACHHTAGEATLAPKIGLPEPLQRNLVGLRELGVIGLSVPRCFGGESFPFTVSSMALEMIARACPSTMVQYAFYVSPAMMLLRFAPEELKRQYVPRLACGEISGAVAMTEPQAGSDVGRVATSAQAVEGGWRLSGRKQFITNGSGDLCIVLARSEPGSQGLEGLSLFLVERQRRENGEIVNNYVVERAEEKICITASATCGLAFADSHAVLLGQRGAGWREILTFMNESRVAVGIQGIGTAQAALEEARAYAAERNQMGKPIREHPLVADMLLDMEATVAALRALAYQATALYDLSEGLRREAEKLPEGEPRRTALERKIRRYARDLRELTPLVKWYGAEEVIRVCRLAMQIHGGYGVIKDYDVERIMRDSLILPIYEGTSQIQSLMAVKDLLKAALARPTALLGGTVSPTLAAASFPGEVGRLYREARTDVNATVRRLLYDLLRQGGREGVVSLLRGRPSIEDDDTQYILLHAERITAMLAHLHAARLLAQQVCPASTGAGRSCSEKPVVAEPCLCQWSDRTAGTGRNGRGRGGRGRGRALPLQQDRQDWEDWEVRQLLAERAMRRAAQVAADGARMVKSGDRSTLRAIAAWRDAS